VARNFRPLGKSELDSTRQAPAADVDVDAAKAVQFNPLSISGEGIVLQLCNDDSGVNSKAARAKSCKNSCNG
jgi:hypothetical protein